MAHVNTPPSASSTPVSPVPIVAVGASVGGLEAALDLFAALPAITGLAYVYIQYPDPQADSHVVAVLQGVTKMPVQEAADELRIQPNHVYVMPLEKELDVIDGVLVPAKISKEKSFTPIDRFFVSLADQQLENIVGIILSGVVSDGTLGLRAIKVAGGITFAQDQTARFQSMPRSAIAEGVVDRVLPPAKIASELERLSREPSLFQPPSQTDEAGETPGIPVSDEDIQVIIQLIRRVVGVDFSHYKMTTIRRRIIRRMLLARLETLPEYAQFLRQHPDETRALYDDLLINVTTFFRDADTMDYLEKVLLPKLVRDKQPRESIRIWIPACSTGQEAYSLAILLLETLGDRASGATIQIFATDLSEQAVAKARLGSYTRGEVMDVTPRRLQRFFTKVDDQYRINKSVRDMCVFAPHNVLKDPPFSRLDLVSCRNLLIYLDTSLQRKVIATFHYALNPNGYLVLGKSETVGSSGPLFTQLEKNYRIYVRRNDGSVDFSPGLFTVNPMYRMSRTSEQAADDSPGDLPDGRGNRDRRGAAKNPAAELERIVDGVLLSRYVPASVVVNQDMDILQFRGSTGLFLEPAPGKASLNLLKMARPALVFELRNAIHKARKTGETVRRTGIDVQIKTQKHYVAIEIVPLTTNGEEQLFLVLFEEVVSTAAAGSDSADARTLRIKQLEQELSTLREDMRLIIEAQEAGNEELQSANEEIISSNEELQSINEELETGKEEIESANEELVTINQELQVRNDQLSEANQFAEAILDTIREATLVLDAELRVRSANKAFYRLFRVREEETEGRLIYELGNRQWDVPQLRQLLDSVVLQNDFVQGFELANNFPIIGEKVMRLNARRVIRQHEAVLLAIEDITEHRLAQRLVEEREAWFRNVADNAPALIWSVGLDGTCTFVNKIWLDFTGRPMEEELGLGWIEDLHPADREQYLTTFHTNFARRQPFQIECRLRRHDGEYRWTLQSARPSVGSDGAFSGYIGTCVDVHIQKTLTEELERRVQERTTELVEKSNLLNKAQAIARIGSYSRDARLGSMTASDGLYRLFGYEPGSIELTYEFVESRTHPDDIGLINALIEKARQNGQPFSYVRRIYWPDGQLRYLYNRQEVICDETGSPLRFVGIAQDITEQKVAARQLEQMAHNLQAVLNSVPAAIGYLKAIFDKPDDEHGDPATDPIIDFRLVVGNQQLADLVGQPLADLIGQSVKPMYSFLWADKTLDWFRRVVTENKQVYEERQLMSNGQLRWRALSANRYDGGVVLTGLDITELKAAILQQEQLLDELAASQRTIDDIEALRQHIRERGDFLRTTTHDLRGSFGIIQGAAQLLDVSDTEEDRTQMLHMLQRNLRQVTLLLTQLMDFSRLESGQETVHIEAFDAAGLLREFGEHTQIMAREKGLALRLEGDDTLPVEGDPIKVRRIVQNLVLNALKYTSEGSVTVSWTSLSDTYWQLSVADTGPGLKPAQVEQLTRLQPSEPPEVAANRTLGSGEGIGLFIVKRLISLLEGKLAIHSKIGLGTRFEVALPRAYAHHAAGSANN